MIKYPLNVTIDSNIFDANKYDFAVDGTLHHLISYVEKNKIKIILSNIVVREISKHIQNNAFNIATLVNNLRKEVKKNYPDNFIENLGMWQILEKADRNTLAQKAVIELDSFLNKLDVEILDSHAVNVEEIFNDYFEFNPPFENNDKKRKEFPDAFIAAQIKARFSNGENVAIVSADKGLKKACGDFSNYLFFDSLGELYDKLNKQEDEYHNSIIYINKLSDVICEIIRNNILDNDCVDVAGMSYDKDGIPEGYDYCETMVEDVSDLSVKIHTIDEITENNIFATLICSADIEVNCYYDDYDNAAWDSESKSYVFLETKIIKEFHAAKFAIRVEINMNSEEVSVSKFMVKLGGDSRTDRIDVSSEEDEYYEQELLDMDRENVGLVRLGNYDNYLENSLENSSMRKDIISRFELFNTLMDEFEEISNVYEEIIDQIKEQDDETKDTVLAIVKELKKIEKNPLKVSNTEIRDKELDEILSWLEKKHLEISDFKDIKKLPDDLEFGTKVSFYDANKDMFTLMLDDIQICPSEGEQEYIDIKLMDKARYKTYEGYIKLTIGYIHSNEDGGIGDGLEDDVEYQYDDIINQIDDVLHGLIELLDNHKQISNILKTYI